MFKSIEYKLISWVCVLVIATGLTVWMLCRAGWFLATVTAALAAWSLYRLSVNYRKYNSNIIFLLNAVENGDYSFRFSTTNLSRREKELNSMFNRIKDILAGARLEVMENEKFLGIIVESTAAGIIIADDRGIVRTANRAALTMLGLPVFTHIKQLGTIDPSYPKLVGEMKPGTPLQVKVANEREEMLLSLTVTLVKIRDQSLRVFSLTNIGNELEAREMESWIKLIRVMTHEIMNSIAPISSLSEILLEEYQSTGEPDPELHENTVEAFSTINSTAKSLLTFVESYRRFTGVPKPELQSVDLCSLVSSTLGLETGIFSGTGIETDLRVPADGCSVNADPTQVRQVLVNLLKNAAEAAGGRPGARVEVRIITTGGNVTLEVRNNGAPIPADVEPHIFIPFFTTKDTGTGIGLSLSRYIMRLHGGNLRYHRTDQWTVFSMVFPS